MKMAVVMVHSYNMHLTQYILHQFNISFNFEIVITFDVQLVVYLYYCISSFCDVFLCM